MLSELRNSISMKHLNLIHSLVISSILITIGHYKNETPDLIFNLLYLLSLGIVLLVTFPNNINGYWSVIKLVHYFIILPSLLYIAYNRNLSEETYNNIFITGIVVSIYHAYKFYTRM